MKYVQISTHADGWGKTILFDRHEQLKSIGVESYVLWARGNHEQDRYMRKIGCLPASVIDLIQTRVDGKAGFHSKMQTKKLLKMLDEIDPDVVHLHVLIGYYLNVQMLFEWLQKHECRVIWTLHDCWAFTGHCIHFTSIGCNRWQTGECGVDRVCPQLTEYPPTINRSNVKWNYQKKRELFTSLPTNRLTIFSPSNWLADLVKQSYLGKYRVIVRHNEIDRKLFREIEPQSPKVRKIDVLGVSTSWSEKKGLSDFFRLAADLGPKRTIVMIGFSKKQIRKLRKEKPANCHLMEKTDSIEELVELYNETKVFFNPTKEDNYPTVNLEAQACGTPVVTYDIGGCRETVFDEKSRCVSSYESALAAVRAVLDESED